MGRNVTLDFSAGGGSDTEFLIGTITLEPTAVHEIGNRVVLPAPRATGINAGVGVLEDVAISPAGPEPAWAYRATVRDSISGKAQSWLVGVPTGTTAIPFKQLTKFVTTVPPQTTAGMMQNWANTTEANADRSELAADRAEAPTDLMNKNLIENSASLTNTALSAAIDTRLSYRNVANHGAVGDGVTNDTAAIQSALDGYGAVYIPAGTYRIDGLNVRSNTTLWGDGIGKTVLYNPNHVGVGLMMADVTAVSVRDISARTTPGSPFNDSGYAFFVGGSSSHVTIRHCEGDGFGNAVFRAGPYLPENTAPAPTDCKFINCQANDVARSGFEIMKAKGTEVSGCTIVGRSVENTVLTHGVRLAGCIDTNVHDNYISNVVNAVAVQAWGGSGGATQTQENSIIHGNLLFGCHTGVVFQQAHCTEIVLSTNIIRDNIYGIRLEGEINGGSQNIAIKNNVLKKNTIAAIFSITLTMFNRLGIENNDFVENGDFNIYFSGGTVPPKNILIRNNRFSCPPPGYIRGFRFNAAPEGTVVKFLFNEFYTSDGSMDINMSPLGTIIKDFAATPTNTGNVY